MNRSDRISAWSTIIAVVALLISAPMACKTPEQAAYKTIGVTATMVDGAMKGWGDYVRSGFATVDDESRVRSAYASYQQAMETARAAIVAVKLGQASKDDKFNTAMSAVSASSTELLKLIDQIKSYP